MRQFIVRVNGEEFQVEVEEVRGSFERQTPVIKPQTPPPVNTVTAKKPVPAATSSEKNVVAPMPGTILGIKVKEGDKVNAGDVVVVLEAMKLENNLNAPVSGTVKSIKTTVGASVNPGDVLVEIE